jgi:hypothetical protein
MYRQVVDNLDNPNSVICSTWLFLCIPDEIFPSFATESILWFNWGGVSSTGSSCITIKLLRIRRTYRSRTITSRQEYWKHKLFEQGVKLSI